MVDNFSRDISGNTIAVIVLIGMLISVVWIAVRFVRGASPKEKTWPGWVIPVLALLGMGVAIYLTFIETTQVEAICGPVGDCNSVQRSPYAKLFGVIPVGLIGLIGYLAILFAWIAQKFFLHGKSRHAWLAIWGFAWLGVLYSIYLTFLEPFVIGATCMWCISSAIIITLILLASTPNALISISIDDDFEENIESDLDSNSPQDA